MFTDINQAAFTTWETDTVIDEGGNYFRIALIDVIDEDGYDHQGIVVVSDGTSEFTQSYLAYVTQLTDNYSENMGVIAGYRNAAAKGDRTYRDTDVDFFCIQDVAFTDGEGIERTSMVIVINGSDDFIGPGNTLYSELRDAYK